MFELLAKLSFTRGLNILLISFGCLIGPFCFIYRFYNRLFQANDFSKVLILSAAIGVPVCLAMTLFNSVILGRLKVRDENLQMEWQLMVMGLSSGLCGLIFYLACIAQFVDRSISVRDAIELMLFAYAGAISYSIWYAIKIKRKRRRKNI